MAQPTILHSATAVLSPRHRYSWFLLAFAAGLVNAGGVYVCGRFVSHMTGIVTHIGLRGLVSWPLMMEYLLVLGAFIAGAMSSGIWLQGRALRKQPPQHATPLCVVAGILTLVSITGSMGLFGPLGGQVEQTGDFGFLCVVAFAMGLMNASVASSTELSVRTTHMTGPATDFGVHLATAWFCVGEQRAQALAMAALRGGKLVAFALGAAAMGPLVSSAGYLAFIAPATIVAAVTLHTFSVKQLQPKPLTTKELLT